MDLLQNCQELQHQLFECISKNKKLEDNCRVLRKENQLLTVSDSQTEGQNKKMSQSSYRMHSYPFFFT
jgi:hypothetical protein